MGGSGTPLVIKGNEGILGKMFTQFRLYFYWGVYTCTLIALWPLYIDKVIEIQIGGK